MLATATATTTASTTSSSPRRPGATATVATKPTENEKLGLLDRVWFSVAELHACSDKLLPASLPTLLEAIVAGDVPRNQSS